MSLDGSAFDRAWDRGFSHGTQTQIVADVNEDLAAEMLRLCGASRDDAKMIMMQARYDACNEHPDLPLIQQRTIAARRVVRLVLRELVARQENAT